MMWRIAAVVASTLAVVVECESPRNYVYALTREVCSAQKKRIEDPGAKVSPGDAWRKLTSQLDLVAKYSEGIYVTEVAEAGGERKRPKLMMNYSSEGDKEKEVPPVQRCLKLQIDITHPSKLRRQFDGIKCITPDEFTELGKSDSALTLSWGSIADGRYETEGIQYFKLDRSGLQYLTSPKSRAQTKLSSFGSLSFGSLKKSSSKKKGGSSKMKEKDNSSSLRSKRRQSLTPDEVVEDAVDRRLQSLQYLFFTSFDFDDKTYRRILGKELAKKIDGKGPFMSVCGESIFLGRNIAPYTYPTQSQLLEFFLPLDIASSAEASAFYGSLEHLNTKISRAPNCIILQIENGEYGNEEPKNVHLLQTNSGITPNIPRDIKSFSRVAQSEIQMAALDIVPYMDHENSASVAYCADDMKATTNEGHQIGDFLREARRAATSAERTFGKRTLSSGKAVCVYITVYNIDRDDYETPLRDRREGFTIFITTTQGLKTLHAMPFWDVSPLDLVKALDGETDLYQSLSQLFMKEVINVLSAPPPKRRKSLERP